jgi:hypothetical protein
MYIYSSGSDIGLARAKLNADEQMCWYLENTYKLFALIFPGL